jgi:microcystin degradation protein MlrC
MGRPRIAIGGILHETHSFADDRTGLSGFREQALCYGPKLLEMMTDTPAAIGGIIHAATLQGFDLVPTVYAAAMPSGIVKEEAYREMLDVLIRHLVDAGPVDGVALALHGAMVTEHEQDPESDILARIREVVGPNCPVVVVLDMHGNISPRMVDLASVLVAFDTNPHVDPYERGVEAVAILGRLLEEKIEPVAAIVQPPVVYPPQRTGTDDLPLQAVHARAQEIEKDERVLCVAVMGGFAYADTRDTGPSLIVTTRSDRGLARQYADELAAIMLEQDRAEVDYLSPAEAVARAKAVANGTAILVDSADNIGGGTPGDGTDALQAMLDLDVVEGTIVLADPEAVAACWEAGERARLSVAVGAKCDRWHGEPILVDGVVQALTNGEFRCELPHNHFASFFGTIVQMGRTAWLRVAGVNIILTEKKIPPFDLAQLRSVGVAPESQQMIVVKSAVAYRAAYSSIASEIFEMDTRGLCTPNLGRFPYRHARRLL